MKNENLILAILSIMLLSITSIGTAVASQTSFDCIVSEGTVQVQAKSQSTMYGSLGVYDKVRYDMNLLGISGTSEISQIAQFGSETEVETNLVFQETTSSKPSCAIFDERAKTERIFENTNSSLCCDSAVEVNALVSNVEYSSTIASNDNDLLFGLQSYGTGEIDILTQEGEISGDLNGTITQTRSSNQLSVYGGNYELTFEFDSLGCNYPVSEASEEVRLCPFVTP